MMKNWIRFGVAIVLAAVLVAPGFSQSRRPNARSTSELNKVQKKLQEDERAKSAAQMVKSKLENQDTDELIRKAQERLKALKSGDSSSTSKPVPTAKPITVARPAPVETVPKPAKPVRAAPVPARPVAATTPAAPANAAPTARSAPVPVPIPNPSAAAPALSPAPAVSTNPSVPPPRPLKPRYDREDDENQSMEITARESQMDSPNHLVTFRGDVHVEHPGFTLKSQELVIYLHEDEGQPGAAPASSDEDRAPFKRAIATGPMVEIERVGEDGKVQIAKSRRADYNAITGDIELSGGPPTLQNGDSLINPEGVDARIFLTKDGKHRVTGGKGGGKVKMNFDLGPKKPGSSSGPSFGPSGLDSITNRNNR